MNELDDLPARLRSQMHAATATDLAPPDLLQRVHRSVARRRQRTTGTLGALAVAAGLAAVALPLSLASPEPERLAAPPSPAEVLSVVRSGGSGRLSVESSSADDLRTERVELPGYVSNNGQEPLTVLAMSVPGTGLQSDLTQQPNLVPGGTLPLSLSRAVDCQTDPSLPARLDLRVSVRGSGGTTSVLLPLPEEVVALYRRGHACSPERRAADDAEAAAADAAAEQSPRQTGEGWRAPDGG